VMALCLSATVASSLTSLVSLISFYAILIVTEKPGSVRTTPGVAHAKGRVTFGIVADAGHSHLGAVS
jgi:hypothetical protein